MDPLKPVLGDLRAYWRELNRQERAAVEHRRQQMKANAKRQAKCQCKAYPWPHRPGSGLCRYPDPPMKIYQRKKAGRPYCRRYAGLRRRIARANGLHPIRDRAEIDRLLPPAITQAKELKRRYPAMKYRNIEITADGVTATVQTIGPDM
jgi:hypothetical protein